MSNYPLRLHRALIARNRSAKHLRGVWEAHRLDYVPAGAIQTLLDDYVRRCRTVHNLSRMVEFSEGAL